MYLRWMPLLCEALMNFKQPFSRVASWSAIQRPTVDIGSVWRYEPSWCDVTSPPTPGFCTWIKQWGFVRYFQIKIHLENVHALSNTWTLIPQLPAQFANAIVESELPEHGMFSGKSVTDFVQSKFLGHQQIVIWANSAGLEKVSNTFARLDEISILILKNKLLKLMPIWMSIIFYLRWFRIGRWEDLAIFFGRLWAQRLASFQHLIDLLVGIESLKNEIAVSFELIKEKIETWKYIPIQRTLENTLSADLQTSTR